MPERETGDGDKDISCREEGVAGRLLCYVCRHRLSSADYRIKNNNEREYGIWNEGRAEEARGAMRLLPRSSGSRVLRFSGLKGENAGEPRSRHKTEKKEGRKVIKNRRKEKARTDSASTEDRRQRKTEEGAREEGQLRDGDTHPSTATVKPESMTQACAYCRREGGAGCWGDRRAHGRGSGFGI